MSVKWRRVIPRKGHSGNPERHGPQRRRAGVPGSGMTPDTVLSRTARRKRTGYPLPASVEDWEYHHGELVWHSDDPLAYLARFFL